MMDPRDESSGGSLVSGIQLSLLLIALASAFVVTSQGHVVASVGLKC
jgi:hypothetical protein